MERLSVISSNIASIGYDPTAQVVEVEFKGGRVYHYLGVDSAAWDAQGEAESVGKWVAGYLKPTHECVAGPYEPEDACGDEHTWPADIEQGSTCEACGLPYSEWQGGVG